MASQISGVKQVTLGGDKNYDTQELVRDLREMKVTPHVAQNNTNRRSAIDGRTTQDHWHAEEGQVTRPGESELAVHFCGGGL
jgi:hypothetical protein